MDRLQIKGKVAGGAGDAPQATAADQMEHHLMPRRLIRFPVSATPVLQPTGADMEEVSKGIASIAVCAAGAAIAFFTKDLSGALAIVIGLFFIWN